MFKKTCYSCGKDSYSATQKGKWLCPYCNKDLTNVKAKPVHEKAGGLEQLPGKGGRGGAKK